MPTTVLENIRGDQLLDALKKLNPDPNQTFRVTLESEEKPAPVKGKWAKVAERMSKENYLNGCSEEVIQSVREFRNNFSLRNG